MQVWVELCLRGALVSESFDKCKLESMQNPSMKCNKLSYTASCGLEVMFESGRLLCAEKRLTARSSLTRKLYAKLC